MWEDPGAGEATTILGKGCDQESPGEQGVGIRLHGWQPILAGSSGATGETTRPCTCGKAAMARAYTTCEDKRGNHIMDHMFPALMVAALVFPKHAGGWAGEGPGVPGGQGLPGGRPAVRVVRGEHGGRHPLRCAHHERGHHGRRQDGGCGLNPFPLSKTEDSVCDMSIIVQHVSKMYIIVQHVSKMYIIVQHVSFTLTDLWTACVRVQLSGNNPA